MVTFSYDKLSRDEVQAISASLRGRYGDAFVAKAHHCVRSNGHESPAVPLVLGTKLATEIPEAHRAKLVQGYLSDFARNVFTSVAGMVGRVAEMAAIRLGEVPEFLPLFVQRADQLATAAPGGQVFRKAVRYVSANITRFWNYVVSLLTTSPDDIELSEEDVQNITEAGNQSTYMEQVARQLSRFIGYAQQVGAGLTRILGTLMGYIGSAAGYVFDGFNMLVKGVMEIPNLVHEGLRATKRAAVKFYFFLMQGMMELHQAMASKLADVEARVEKFVNAVMKRLRKLSDWFSRLAPVQALNTLWRSILDAPIIGPLIKGLGYVFGAAIDLTSAVVTLIGKCAWAIRVVLAAIYQDPLQILTAIWLTASPVLTGAATEVLEKTLPLGEIVRAESSAVTAGGTLTQETQEMVNLANRMGSLPRDRLSKDTRRRLREAAEAVTEFEAYMKDTLEANQAETAGVSVKRMYKSAARNAELLTNIYYGEPMDAESINDLTAGRYNMDFRVLQERAETVTGNLEIQLQGAIAEAFEARVTGDAQQREQELNYQETLERMRAARVTARQKTSFAPGTKGASSNASPIAAPVAKETPYEQIQRLWRAYRGNDSVPETVVEIEEALSDLKVSLEATRGDAKTLQDEILEKTNEILQLYDATSAASNSSGTDRRTQKTMSSVTASLLENQQQDLEELIQRLEAAKESFATQKSLYMAMEDYNARETRRIWASSFGYVLAVLGSLLLGYFAVNAINALIETKAQWDAVAAKEVGLVNAVREDMLKGRAFAAEMLLEYEKEKGSEAKLSDANVVSDFARWANKRAAAIVGDHMMTARQIGTNERYLQSIASGKYTPGSGVPLLSGPGGTELVPTIGHSDVDLYTSAQNTAVATSKLQDKLDRGVVSSVWTEYGSLLPTYSLGHDFPESMAPQKYLQNAYAGFTRELSGAVSTAENVIYKQREEIATLERQRLADENDPLKHAMNAVSGALSRAWQRAQNAGYTEDEMKIRLSTNQGIIKSLIDAKDEDKLNYLLNSIAITATLMSGIVGTLIIGFVFVVVTISDYRKGTVQDGGYWTKRILGLLSTVSSLWVPLIQSLTALLRIQAALRASFIFKYLHYAKLAVGLVGAMQLGLWAVLRGLGSLLLAMVYGVPGVFKGAGRLVGLVPSSAQERFNEAQRKAAEEGKIERARAARAVLGDIRSSSRQASSVYQRVRDTAPPAGPSVPVVETTTAPRVRRKESRASPTPQPARPRSRPRPKPTAKKGRSTIPLSFVQSK